MTEQFDLPRIGKFGTKTDHNPVHAESGKMPPRASDL
jgi:hypothetical protein